jgi:uncharacterized protein
MPDAPEQRTIDVDVQDVDTRGRTLHGYAAVYGATSGDLGGFRETIARGAFRNVLGADVRCLLNHDPSQVLGRTRAGTLRLADEERGLRFECDLPDSPLGENVRAAVRRGDIDGASFRFVVGEEEWQGDVRTVKSVQELRDVTVATYQAYPDASVELRTRDNDGGSAAREEGTMPENEGAAVEERQENESGEERAEDRSEERAEQRGSLRAEERVEGAGSRGLADEFRARGWPQERGEVTFDEFRAASLAAGSSLDDLAPSRQTGVGLGADERTVYGAFPRVAVGSSTTSVDVVRQSGRTLADAEDVVRDLAEVSPKPETDSEVEIAAEALKQVASVSSGIPNVYLESQAVASVIENDLRLAINEGLDSLVLAELADADSIPAGDPVIIGVRKAITLVRAAGYSPSLLIVDPQTDEELDTEVAEPDTLHFLWGPGQGAGSIFGLRRVVSKSVQVPVVCDAAAVGRLYASPVSLQRFEMDSGASNRSLIRMEMSALFGVERLAAAVQVGVGS